MRAASLLAAAPSDVKDGTNDVAPSYDSRRPRGASDASNAEAAETAHRRDHLCGEGGWR